MHNLFDKNGIWQVLESTMLHAKDLEKAVNYLSQKNPLVTHIGISTENDFKTAYPVDFELIYQHFSQYSIFLGAVFVKQRYRPFAFVSF